MNLRTLFPRASKAFLKANEADPDPPLPHTQPQQNQTPALDPATPREKKSMVRSRIRFTGYRVRPLDPDNYAASVKDLLDGLKHAHLIPDDAPQFIILETTQVQVQHYGQERTVIDINDGLC